MHSSGEKTNPVPLEQALLRAATPHAVSVCVLGAGMPRPVGVFQLDQSSVISDDARTAAANAIIRAIAGLNETLPPYSRLGWRQAIVLVPGVHSPLLTSHKGNVVRQAASERFGPELTRSFADGSGTEGQLIAPPLSVPPVAPSTPSTESAPVLASSVFSRAVSTATDAITRGSRAMSELTDLRRDRNEPAVFHGTGLLSLSEPLMTSAVAPTHVIGIEDVRTGKSPNIHRAYVIGGDTVSSGSTGWLAIHQTLDEDEEGEKVGGGADFGWESLNLIRRGNSRERSPTAARCGHFYALLMFCVVVRHVVHKYQQHSQLLTSVHLWPAPLRGVHNALGLVAIPGFVTVAGWRDLAEPPRTLRALAFRVGAPLAICMLMEFALPPILRHVYAGLGVSADAVHRQSVLPYYGSWLILLVALCRLALYTALRMRVPPAALGVVAVGAHFACALFDCPWPLRRYGRRVEHGAGLVGPVLSAYWQFYAALPLLLPRSYLRPIDETWRGRAALVRTCCALYVLAASAWALDHFNTEFSSAADRRRYGCDGGNRTRTRGLATRLIADGCAHWTTEDVWQDVVHNGLSASVIVALGHLMPSTPTLLSAVGECSVVCLIVHLCLWGLLWPTIWQAVEASARLTPAVLPLVVLFGCALLVQLATSFHLGLSAPCCGRSRVRVPFIRPPSGAAFAFSWAVLLALKVWAHRSKGDTTYMVESDLLLLS